MRRFTRHLRLLSAAMVLSLLIGLAWLCSDLPSINSLPQRLYTPSVRIVDRQGRLLYEILAEDGGRHSVVPLEQMPLALRQATIATEDRHFYQHPGIDLVGVLRALWINARGGQAGGSTITQQVARNLLLGAGERGQRSLRRKLREAILAWQLTRRFDKDEILALYLNQTYYGGMAYGAEAAAHTFFGKPVSELDLAEAAILAGLPQAPATYNPFTHPEAAKERQKIVLALMEENGYITQEQRLLAEREPLVFAETPYPMEAPHFVMMVRSELDDLFTTEQAYQAGGFIVRTTLDLDWQKLAERAVTRQLADLKRSEDSLGHNVNNAALVAIDPDAGDILALVGSPDYFDAENNGAINMATAPRQPGSALKPLVYAASFDPSSPSGGWTAATMLLDVSTAFTTHDGQSYTPANYDRREHGPVLAREALASSLNIPAVLALQHVGLDALTTLAGRVGITTLEDPHAYDLSLALGGGAVRLVELTAAYGAFANGGYRVQPRLILDIKDVQGNTAYSAPEFVRQRVLDEKVAWLVSDILSDNDARRLGFGSNSLLRLDRPAAVKTGTTSNFHDNWTVGYTPELVVGVWSGNTDYRPMRDVNGLSGAAPIWHQFMRTVLSGRPAQGFTRPPGMVRKEICALSGLLPGDACAYRRWEWFIDGTQPVKPDAFYRYVTIDTLTGGLASAGTPPEQRTQRVALDLPPPARPWARSQGLILYADLQPQEFAVSRPLTTQPATVLQFVTPAWGSIYRISRAFDASAQRIQLETVGAMNLRQVTLWVDGIPLAHLDSPPYQAWWTLAPGVHQAWATAVLESGQQVESERVEFTVLAP